MRADANVETLFLVRYSALVIEYASVLLWKFEKESGISIYTVHNFSGSCFIIIDNPGLFYLSLYASKNPLTILSFYLIDDVHFKPLIC